MSSPTYQRGDIVYVPFPHADEPVWQDRNALVVAMSSGDDLILCKVTKQLNKDEYCVNITNSDLLRGKMIFDSSIRPNCLFTCSRQRITKNFGSINLSIMNQVLATLQQIFQ